MTETNKTEPVQVAIAILHQNGKFLLQLRDNTPGILYPGYWAFFGGHLEPGEAPEVALQREIFEEIHYRVPSYTKFACNEDNQVIRHVYAVPLTVGIEELELNEGWDMGLFTLDEIRKGERYSEKANQVRPLGKPHQRILLEFIQQNASQ
jgi:8-oxo-dGTP diphosphatase